MILIWSKQTGHLITNVKMKTAFWAGKRWTLKSNGSFSQWKDDNDNLRPLRMREKAYELQAKIHARLVKQS
jgi:hypothetical protein